MIRFACPACQKVLKTSDEGVGRKTSCPRCGQRMLIPPRVQVQDKTVLGLSMPARRRDDQDEPRGLGTRTKTDSIVFFGIIGAMIGCIGLALIGLVLSQYWPVFGGFIENNVAEPWSRPRESLIPIHLLVFGVLGLVLGGGLGVVLGFLVGTLLED